MVKKTVTSLKAYKAEPSLLKLKNNLGLKSLTRLSANENAFGTSPKVPQALIKWGFKNVNRYPDSNCKKLRNLLAQSLQISSDKFLFGDGSDEIIELISRVILEPGDEVILPQLTFAEYYFHSRIEGAHIKPIKLTKKGFVDLNSCLKSITSRTKIIWLCNPNNPTGTYINKEQIKSFLQRVPQWTTVVIDEAYIDFVSEEKNPSSISLSKEFSNLIVLRTFSKVYGMANFRIGFAVINHPLIDYLQTVRLPYNLSTFVEIAALAAFKDQKFVKNVVSAIIFERKKWEQFLVRKKLIFCPSQANFIFFHIKNENQLYSYLLHHGYLVRNNLCDNWLRITIGKEADNKKVQTLISTFLKGNKT